MKVILSYSKKVFGFENFTLWGRSMGAVTSILYLEQNKYFKVKYLVADSPFYKLKETIAHFTRNKLGYNLFLIKLALNFIKSNIKEKTGYDIMKLNIKDSVPKITIPVSLIASKNDEMVPYKHFETIYELF